MKETKFKQTEVGMIPSDWEVKTLGELYKVHNGLSKGKQFFGHGYPFLSFSVVFNNVFIPNKLENLVDSSKEERASYSINKGDVFITRTSETVDELGMSCVALKDYPNATYNGFCKRLRPNDVEFVNLGYLGFYLRSDFIREWFLKFSTVTTRASLKNDELLSLPLVLPPTIEEQQRIANALSDVDTLIANLEKLIAKKKNIKQGAMQQLLTGKKRLPGFAPDERREMKKGNRHCEERSDAAIQSGYKMTEVGFIPNDWIVEPLANIANTASGGTPSRSKETFYKGPIKWFTTTELRDCNLYDSVEHISKKAVECSSAKIFPKDTLLMAMYGATIGKLGLLKCDAATNQACCAIFPKKTDVLYLYYFLLYNRENIIAMGCGAGQPNVSQEIVKKINIPLPPTVKEQTAIANVLSDMDTEIATLETKLAKYRKLKTGMMQQLLTGKIRLV